mmetsp:Transcript_24965/g.31148  ORF Transcript_24965/g.31148 Transcript_24965/m.31148 type:complete len:111 (+) Transcript_24965:865-1197(+)
MMLCVKFVTKKKLPQFKLFSNVTLKPSPVFRITKVTWYRQSFTDFVSKFGALVLSTFSGISFMMAGYHEYTKNSAMLASLYGETNSADRTTTITQDDSEVPLSTAETAFN